VATLVGFGSAKPKQALLWAAFTTALGAGFSFWAARGLVKSFSTGLFASGTPLDTPFFVAVLVGACGWILFATRTGLPVSTTHAIIGALTGAGLVAFGAGQLEWGFLGSKFAVPLAASPLLSLAAVYVLSAPVVFLSRRFAPKQTDPDAEQPGTPSPVGRAVDGIHWLSAGLVGFARGWNDAPKIAALALVVLSGRGGTAAAFTLVTVAMAVGGLVAGRRVLETLSRKVTVMPLPESLTASLTTAAFVSLASWNALPVSTTHVSTGGIIGAGIRNDPRAVQWKKVGEIVLSWVVTLPCAALISALAFALVRLVR
jgi:PiT family inorganic phosphate transporter